MRIYRRVSNRRARFRFLKQLFPCGVELDKISRPVDLADQRIVFQVNVSSVVDARSVCKEFIRINAIDRLRLHFYERVKLIGSTS